jgi:DNA-binding MarR family transcriptional regulator
MTPAGELRYLILGAQREGNRKLASRLAAEGLTPAQAEVISVLELCGSLTLAELGRRLVCETGSPSRLVDALVRAGHVDRVQSAADRRRVELTLTAAGREKAVVVSAVDAELESALAALPEALLRDASEALRLLLDGTDAGGAIRLRSAQESTDPQRSSGSS